MFFKFTLVLPKSSPNSTVSPPATRHHSTRSPKQRICGWEKNAGYSYSRSFLMIVQALLTLLHALQDLQIQTEASTNRLQDVRRRDPSNPALFYDIWKFMRGWPQFPWFQDLAKLFWLKGLNTDLSYRRPMGLPFFGPSSDPHLLMFFISL